MRTGITWSRSAPMIAILPWYPCRLPIESYDPSGTTRQAARETCSLPLLKRLSQGVIRMRPSARRGGLLRRQQPRASQGFSEQKERPAVLLLGKAQRLDRILHKECFSRLTSPCSVARVFGKDYPVPERGQ